MKKEQLSFSVWAVQADIIGQAAEKEGLKVQDFCRKVLTEYACKVLKVKVPELEPIKRGRKSALADLARASGLTPEQFKKQLLAEAIAKKLAA